MTVRELWPAWAETRRRGCGHHPRRPGPSLTTANVTTRHI
jgi:hypothetical protein